MRWFHNLYRNVHEVIVGKFLSKGCLSFFRQPFFIYLLNVHSHKHEEKE